MNWIKNLSVLVCSILIALIIFEIGLRINGRYDSQASLKVGGVDTIWTRQANTQEFHSHPDLGKEIIIRFGQYGSRITEPGTELKARKAGLFGDSYTENRRIESKFTFGEILNDLVEDTSFLNFGVDGFGLEQSYAHYLKKKDKLKLDKVFYLLCSNDLRNTYEAQLFDRNKMAKGYAVLNPGLAQIPWQIKFASKMHITYLLIEGYFKGIRSINIQKQQLAKKLGHKFSEGRRDFNVRLDDGYADSILNRFFSGEESGYDKEIIDHFKATLKMWKDDVESENARFYILVLPDEQTRKLALALGIKDYIQLRGNEFFEELSGKPWRFQYDGHWNEYGNLAGALTIIESMKSLTPLEIAWTSYDHIIKKHIQKIDELYGLVKATKGL